MFVYVYMGGFPKIEDTILGVPIIRTIVFWGVHWGSLILGNYHIYKDIHVYDYVHMWTYTGTRIQHVGLMV